MSILNKKEDDRNLKKRKVKNQSLSNGYLKEISVKENLPKLGNAKLSIAECRKIIIGGPIPYTDEELINLRDWLDNLADIAFAIIENAGVNEMNEILNNLTKK